MVNRVILIGNLGRDPEVRRLENGAVVAKFSVATNENYKDKSGEWQTQTEWHDIVVWRSLAERAEQQLKKGAQIYLEGKLTHRSWQDQEGNNRRTTEVVANYFRMIGRREGGGDQGGGYFPSATDEQQANTNLSAPSAPTATPAPTTTNQEAGAPADDDLPF
ncbi:MAG: single-stranded DNA-binding protein [Saprospiraceae bacterium]|nr:single-stranded DNA-binding protein [Saprospiraceae bacterium]